MDKRTGKKNKVKKPLTPTAPLPPNEIQPPIIAPKKPTWGNNK